jgi:hypothetical protein
LSNDGVHDPKTPLFETADKLNVPPEQIGAIAVKVGSVVGFTVIVIDAVLAHIPAVAVNV